MSELGWLERASDLLREPDPGPTPFAVEGLLVEGAIAAFQGPEKVGKTWVVLELALALVTGRPAFGRFAVPNPGPVMVVLEESGRAALHRRLDALVRGYRLDPDDLAGLYVAANRRVRLNDRDWQCRLLDAARTLGPGAIFLDPLARLKGADVDENVQREIGPVLDFLRDLRDDSGAAIPFVHHTGHERTRLRGSSDLEAYWESKIVVGREDATLTLAAEHREAEPTPPFKVRLAWERTSRSLRLDATDGPTKERVAAYLRMHPRASKNEVYQAVGGRKQDVLAAVDELRQAGAPEAVPEEPEPPGTTASGSPLAPGSADPLSPRRGEGSGTGADGAVPAEREPVGAS